MTCYYFLSTFLFQIFSINALVKKVIKIVWTFMGTAGINMLKWICHCVHILTGFQSTFSVMCLTQTKRVSLRSG